ncbi:MAG: hypothetical protein IJ727_09060 [Treponema sp.]|nr:hypothetical protein [Treponema sp.]
MLELIFLLIALPFKLAFWILKLLVKCAFGIITLGLSLLGLAESFGGGETNPYNDDGYRE